MLLIINYISNACVSLHESCEYGDFVKLFLHLNEEGVNEKTRWNSILCGKIADIEQTHYSSGSNLIFEFRSDWRNGNNTGFRGTYRFLNKRKCFIHFITYNNSLTLLKVYFLGSKLK
jgi:hypothetical protein